ncbi:MAG: hypothetical protein ACRETB_09465 [Steroidobacteraceae bacterium]
MRAWRDCRQCFAARAGLLYLGAVRDSIRSDFVTRYFLRRLAAAQRESRGVRGASGARRAPGPNLPLTPPGDSRAYGRALSDVMSLFVLVPGIAFFSIGASVCLTVQPALLAAAHAGAPLAAVLLVTFGFVLLGHLALGWRLHRYREDPSAARAFDTDRDREIAFWQKLVVTALFGFVAPLCALAVVANS